MVAVSLTAHVGIAVALDGVNPIIPQAFPVRDRICRTPTFKHRTLVIRDDHAMFVGHIEPYPGYV